MLQVPKAQAAQKLAVMNVLYSYVGKASGFSYRLVFSGAVMRHHQLVQEPKMQ